MKGRRTSGRRRWVIVALAAVGLGVVLPLGFILVALLEPEDGPGSQIVVAIEQQIRQNEELHYNIHRTLGRVFSLCPCTARLSRSQYAKAFYHRPRPSPQP